MSAPCVFVCPVVETIPLPLLLIPLPLVQSSWFSFLYTSQWNLGTARPSRKGGPQGTLIYHTTLTQPPQPLTSRISLVLSTPVTLTYSTHHVTRMVTAPWAMLHRWAHLRMSSLVGQSTHRLGMHLEAYHAHAIITRMLVMIMLCMHLMSHTLRVWAVLRWAQPRLTLGVCVSRISLEELSNRVRMNQRRCISHAQQLRIIHLLRAITPLLIS